MAPAYCQIGEHTYQDYFVETMASHRGKPLILRLSHRYNKPANVLGLRNETGDELDRFD